jgi:hypothetical protein
MRIELHFSLLVVTTEAVTRMLQSNSEDLVPSFSNNALPSSGKLQFGCIYFGNHGARRSRLQANGYVSETG